MFKPSCSTFSFLFFFLILFNGVSTAGLSFQETQKLKAVDGESFDFFGSLVDVSGEFVVVGAKGNKELVSSSGSVYVFRFSGTSWNFTQKLTEPGGGAENGRFGSAFAIYGELIVVGAVEFDDNGQDKSKAYVYLLNGTAFGISHILSASSSSPFFGVSCAVSDQWIAIGSSGDSEGTGCNGGSVFLFSYDGAFWNETQKLIAGDSKPGKAFRSSLAIYEEWLVVGAHEDSSNGGFESGSAYLFFFDGSKWTEAQKLTAPSASFGENFGRSVSISGKWLVVGSPNDGDFSTSSGSAFVFALDGFKMTWNFSQHLTASSGDAPDRFGTSFFVTREYLLVGADGEDDLGDRSGSAFVFDFNGSLWDFTTRLKDLDGRAGDQFGSSVAVAGSTFFCGSPNSNGTAADSGSVLVYSVDCGGACPSCPANKYVPPQNLSQCVTCIGTVSADGFGCSPCLAPDVFDSGNNTCVTCSAQRVNSSVCLDSCPADSFSDLFAQCIECGFRRVPATGDPPRSCRRCSPETAERVPGLCLPCPTGEVPNYNSTSPQPVCLRCPTNAIVIFDDENNEFQCACPSGFTRSSDGVLTCKEEDDDDDSHVATALGGGLGGGFGALLLLGVCCMCCLFCALCIFLVVLVAVAVLLAVVVVVVVVALVFGAALGVGLYVKKRSQAMFNLANFENYDGETVADGLERDFRELAFADLAFDKKIGEGAFGRVFLGVWRGTTYVAIKELNVTADDKAKREFIHEANVMARVGVHPNVVHFIGAVTTEQRFYMVTEFAQNGSLLDYLCAHRHLSDAPILQFARDAAAGIVHLHAEAIVHRDIAARNFLVAKDLSISVADFGLSRIVDAVEGEAAAESRRTKSNIGPVRWMAPESLRHQEYSEATDVYMFGCFLFELASRGAMPFEGLSVQEVMVAVTERRLRPSVPPSCPTLLSDIMRRCWRENPGSRPPMDFVYRKLLQVIEGAQSAGPATEQEAFAVDEIFEVNYCSVGSGEIPQDMSEMENLRAEIELMRTENDRLKGVEKEFEFLKKNQ